MEREQSFRWPNPPPVRDKDTEDRAPSWPGAPGSFLRASSQCLQGGLQADFHVQGIGARKVDSDVEVTDDDLICQVESVAVCGMGLIPLYWGRKVRGGRAEKA